MENNPFRITVQDPHLTPEEVLYVREEPDADAELWGRCIRESLCVVTARDTNTNKIIGVGFLAGNSRHCQIVDLSVHPSVRQNGAGESIGLELISFARDIKVRYLGLTYDTKSPWLKTAYEKHGFRVIDFAMWHEDSLKEQASAHTPQA